MPNRDQQIIASVLRAQPIDFVVDGTRQARGPRLAMQKKMQEYIDRFKEDRGGFTVIEGWSNACGYPNDRCTLATRDEEVELALRPAVDVSLQGGRAVIRMAGEEQSLYSVDMAFGNIHPNHSKDAETDDLALALSCAKDIVAVVYGANIGAAYKRPQRSVEDVLLKLRSQCPWTVKLSWGGLPEQEIEFVSEDAAYLFFNAEIGKLVMEKTAEGEIVTIEESGGRAHITFGDDDEDTHIFCATIKAPLLKIWNMDSAYVVSRNGVNLFQVDLHVGEVRSLPGLFEATNEVVASASKLAYEIGYRIFHETE